ncbi:MAG: hypothetical protein PVJ49_12355 [Acidobacteriota bacterium]|jgi:hypothetical protein
MLNPRPALLTRAHRRFAATVCLVVTLVPTGCASTDRTPPLFAATALPVTLTEFRLRLSDFTEFFVAVVEDATEIVIDSSRDQQVRRNAMEFRLRTVTMFLNSLNQTDPVASLIDAWAFCLQLQQYVGPDGAGAELFGEEQPGIVAAVDSIRAEVESLVDAVAKGPAPDEEAIVLQWAATHPLSSSPLVRTSSAVLLAEQLENRSNSPFAALGQLQAGIDELVAQFQRYISVLPRSVRWQSQLILHETLYDEFDLGATMETFDLLSAGALELSAAADELLAELPNGEELQAELDEVMAEIASIVEAERARMLAEIDRQRGLIFDDVTLQREAIMRDVDTQIAIIDEQMQQRLDEVFVRIETLTETTLRQSFDETERLMDQIFIRILVLILVLLAGIAGLIVLRKRLNRPPGVTDR